MANTYFAAHMRNWPLNNFIDATSSIEDSTAKEGVNHKQTQSISNSPTK